MTDERQSRKDVSTHTPTLREQLRLEPINYPIGVVISAFVGNARKSGTLVKNNVRTVWMRLPNGDLIKRHKTKHDVQSVKRTS